MNARRQEIESDSALDATHHALIYRYVAATLERWRVHAEQARVVGFRRKAGTWLKHSCVKSAVLIQHSRHVRSTHDELRLEVVDVLEKAAGCMDLGHAQVHLRAETTLRDDLELHDGEWVRRAHALTLKVVLTIAQALLPVEGRVVEQALLDRSAALAVVDVAVLGQAVDEGALLVLGRQIPHELHLAVVSVTMIVVEVATELAVAAL